VRAVVPKHCYKTNTLISLACLAKSVVLTVACALTSMLIPLKVAALPLWLAYGVVTGTVAMGLWVLAHECGHGAFSSNRLLQDSVGYILHSLLLVPYFSWQRSHAVHHSRTNHIGEGETHVPPVIDGVAPRETPGGAGYLDVARQMGVRAHGALQLFMHLVIGWPAYLLAGATGGPVRGVTNHFVPTRPFSTALWPNKWPNKVWLSDLGVGATLAALAAWAVHAGSVLPVLAVYGLPLLVINGWLIIYTWLQHTDVDVPHLGNDAWSFMRGAFLTIDRPYGPLFDSLHHRIGSTHVAHHIDSTIPHYHAREATDAIAAAFPKAYLYEPTPVHLALWRVAKNCIATRRTPEGRYIFVPP